MTEDTIREEEGVPLPEEISRAARGSRLSRFSTVSNRLGSIITVTAHEQNNLQNHFFGHTAKIWTFYIAVIGMVISFVFLLHALSLRRFDGSTIDSNQHFRELFWKIQFLMGSILLIAVSMSATWLLFIWLLVQLVVTISTIVLGAITLYNFDVDDFNGLKSIVYISIFFALCFHIFVFRVVCTLRQELIFTAKHQIQNTTQRNSILPTTSCPTITNTNASDQLESFT